MLREVSADYGSPTSGLTEECKEQEITCWLDSLCDAVRYDKGQSSFSERSSDILMSPASPNPVNDPNSVVLYGP